MILRERMLKIFSSLISYLINDFLIAQFGAKKKFIMFRCSSILKRLNLATISSRLTSSNATPSSVPYKSLKSDDVSTPTSIPQSADVVIIGGGIIGCSTLYHLTKLGCTNVVLLEKDQLTAGTTWHTAGLIWRLRPNDTDIQILNHTRHLLNDVLEEETGVHPGWINNGGLFIANSKERLNEYKRLMTIGKAFGIESHILSPSETKKLYPLMNVSDLYGTLYSPGDGTVDPAGFLYIIGSRSHEIWS
ncbi:sarcosine dehydrogenase, mitochondrial [Caerostris extrusa]|uniref:Sarcosine dehydrogenase, mitochondrial n=1 Tax=Caerostris extrusa TaxID=172846 RepID=A0AAV4P3U9_CAEEX|nr:sarcosine dehydrogenase, mitochondrial [Caerostris extrusa]